ncbi:beta-1,3-galactosyltransferase 1 [Mytilus galloprovincialis]|uniref:Hexosyltransferase n=1 Tax=Mytilus galloprovincialis TaxID=29158 RepID=A0A8B6CH97_MYTGA|nr:beta-1,3-galactosyltransferase 1 [Mytilus galloprovincialis]
MLPRIPSIYRGILTLVGITLLLFMLLMQGNRPDTVSLRRLEIQNEVVGSAKIREEFGMEKSTANIRTTLRTIKETVRYQNTDTRNIVNPHNFSYLKNPVNICSEKDIYMITYIHTSPKNFHKRQTIRSTWGDKRLLEQYKTKIVFVMGRVEDTKVMNKLDLENAHYGDIVQEDFLDSYKNLTYKGIAALKWISNYCNNTVFTLKTDDDILVNIFKLVKHLKEIVEFQLGHKNLILCNQWLRMAVLRDKNSKWYIPKEDFTPDYFPPYCSGSAFVLSTDMTSRMYNASLYEKFFWVDDYYITGMLPSHIKVKQKRLNEAYILNGRVVYDKLVNDTKNQLMFFHVPKLNTIFSMWRLIKQRLQMHIQEEFTWSPVVSPSTVV